MEDKKVNEVIEKLDKIMRIVALSGTHGLSVTEKIVMLERAGFRPVEISDILGITQNTVNVRLSQLRKIGGGDDSG